MEEEERKRRKREEARVETTTPSTTTTTRRHLPCQTPRCFRDEKCSRAVLAIHAKLSTGGGRGREKKKLIPQWRRSGESICFFTGQVVQTDGGNDMGGGNEREGWGTGEEEGRGGWRKRSKWMLGYRFCRDRGASGDARMRLH